MYCVLIPGAFFNIFNHSGNGVDFYKEFCNTVSIKRKYIPMRSVNNSYFCNSLRYRYKGSLVTLFRHYAFSCFSGLIICKCNGGGYDHNYNTYK